MALTKVMAGEGGAHNILVNAMLVGLIVSDQWVQRHAKTAPGTDFDEFTNNLAKGIPLGRMGTAEEFANWPASWRPSRAPTSPVPPSMSTAAVRRWFDCSSHGEERASSRLAPWPRMLEAHP